MTNRIREIRQQRGLKLYELAEKLGTDPPQLSRWETGAREPDNATIERIASALETTPADVMGWNSSGPQRRMVPLVGYAGVDFMVYSDARAGRWKAVEEVEAPPGTEGLRALRVVGSALEPVYHDGDLLFFPTEPGRPEDYAGRMVACVVQPVGMIGYVRRIVRTDKPGRYKLEAHGMEPVECEIEWACPVLWVRHAV